MNAQAPPDNLYNRHYHLLRRLHSLTGVVPIGVFLFAHLFTNGSIAFGGAETFEHEIDFIYSLPGLIALEVFGIWLPIAFHAALGMVYVFTGKPNTGAYRYSGNLRYTLMRTTGIIALLFIFIHISTTRWGWGYWSLLDTPFDRDRATESTAAALQVYWWMPWFYALGVIAIVFHFANGLWTFAITWGLTISTTAQKRWGVICAGIGVVLLTFGLAATWTFSTYDIEPSTTDTPTAPLVDDTTGKPADRSTEFALEQS